MAQLLKNLVVELINPPGTGAIALSGTSPDARISFTEAGFVNNDTPGYFMTDGTQEEWGIGTFISGTPNTIARTTILGNTNGDTSPINFTGSNAITVYNWLPAENAVFVDTTGNFVDGKGNRLVPRGVLWAWYGQPANVPSGWAICDGTNGTPNLVGKFLFGCDGVSVPVGTTGGAASVTATTSSNGNHNHNGLTDASSALGMTATADAQGTHTHGGSTASHNLGVNELAPHNHDLGTQVQTVQAGTTGIVLPFTATFNGSYIDNTGNGDGHAHGIGSDGLHAHNITVSNVPAHQHGIENSGDHAHSVTVATVPPYMAVIMIMKL